MKTLYYGDNLQILREHIKDESVDLIYLDPPFNSNASYNVLFKSPTKEFSHAQIEAFEDTWHWVTGEAEEAFDQVMQGGNADAAEMLRSLRLFLGENDMMAYIAMMTPRLMELHRTLKMSGSLYLHCDATASHYLKIIMDGIFGGENCRNEITWKRTSAHANAGCRYAVVQDRLLFYTKTDEWTWNPLLLPYSAEYIKSHYGQIDKQTGRAYTTRDLTASMQRASTGQLYEWKGFRPPPSRCWAYTKENMEKFESEGLLTYSKRGMPRLKLYLDEMGGVPCDDLWTDIFPINSQAQERLGYPTQKPVALLERIIGTSSNEGDVILDPFCGCGTTIHAAQKLNRQWIGIDVTNLAISLIEKRLTDAFPGIQFEVHGTPTDMDGARELAAQDKYQFQWWAVSLVKAVPYGGKKKGADTGIDGFIYFKPDARTTEKAIVSVKGGDNVNVVMVRDLAHVVKREKAQMGIFITLAEPTGPMMTEAVKEGLYKTPYGVYPRLQIRTIAELLEGKQPNVPLIDPSGFKKAAREGDTTEQDALPF
jgi:site-specific DNA-methyltransferase (adenine-specific)